MAEWLEEQSEEQTQEEVITVQSDEGLYEEEAQPEQPNVPEKYASKSFEDVVKMHSEAEKLIGKHSQEVGELRRVVDTYIQQAMTEQKPAEPEEEVDYFSDPEKAINRAVERHPAVQQAQASANQFKQSQALSQLQKTHPDMQEVLTDPAFSEWVKKSAMRQKMYQMADSNYDYDAADELISNYKELKGMAAQVHTEDKNARRTAVRSAGAGGTQGSGAQPAKKIYRRADIIKLMKTDPNRYDSLADEISRAYAEGRVK